jgi:protein-disulfide isomerase
MTNSANDASKKARRDHARETARLEREKEKKRRLRNRIFIQGGVVLGVLAVALVGVLIFQSATKTVVPSAGPANMISDGIVFQGVDGTPTVVSTGSIPIDGTPTPTVSDATDGIVAVDTYVDWTCPICQQFESTYSSTLTSLVADNSITLEVHPIAILDGSYVGSRYSSRAANAAACVANFEPDTFLDAQSAMYVNQGTEGTTGLTDNEIKSILSDAGVTSADVTSCIDDEKFASWVTDATARATSDASLADPSTGGFGTPTVMINGVRWDGTTDISAAVQTASEAELAAAGSTPEPTSTPTE